MTNVEKCREWVVEQLSYTDDHWTTSEKHFLSNILKMINKLEDLNKAHREDCKIIIEVCKENEKLKKAIEDEIELLIERRFNAYSCDNYEVYNVIDAIIEELKEVLGDAK